MKKEDVITISIKGGHRVGMSHFNIYIAKLVEKIMKENK